MSYLYTYAKYKVNIGIRIYHIIYKILVMFTAVFLLHSCRAVTKTPEVKEKPAAASAPRKNIQTNAYALLIGINKYKYAPDLLGAVNDVHSIKRLLVDSFDFKDDERHIKVLTNEQATRKAIIEAIENHLLAKANKNSVVVLHYSGHGSQLKDVSGDEADGYDETIVPHDSGRKPHPNKDITDDELNLLLARLAARTPNVTFIFDSCHSGTATRAAGLARTVPTDDRTPDHQTAKKVEIPYKGSDDNSDLRAKNSAYVLISGSSAEEESLELRENGQTYGAMTWFLTDQIRQAGTDITYRDVMDIVRAKVSTKYPSQHPQLEGTGMDRLVFNTRSSVPKPYILVAPKDLKKVTLKAGQVHGVSKGSIYDIFPPGEKQFSNARKAIAKIKVSAIYPTVSDGEIIEGGKVQAASRAIERQHSYPDPVLKVFLKDLNTSQILRQIKKELSDFKHIKILQKQNDYDLLLREHFGYIITEAGDPTEIAPRLAISDADVVYEAVNQVTQWGKWFNILNIKNNNPKLNIDFNIETSSSSEELIEGAEFTITINNNSGHRLYLALIDLSSDGQIQMVFPKANGKDYLAPGHSLKKRLRAYLPEKLESIRDVLKIIATTEPTDYHFLEQQPIRGAPSLKNVRGNHTSPLEELIASAALGTTRGVGVAANLVDPGNWVTLERTIKVIRRVD